VLVEIESIYKMHGAYIKIADTFASFPHILFTRHRRVPEICVYTLPCSLTNIEPTVSLDKFSASTRINLALKAVKFQCEMAARYQRWRLWTAALIFVMSIVAKVFRDKISTDSFSVNMALGSTQHLTEMSTRNSS
jgi:hypothetical protein